MTNSERALQDWLNLLNTTSGNSGFPDTKSNTAKRNGTTSRSLNRQIDKKIIELVGDGGFTEEEISDFLREPQRVQRVLGSKSENASEPLPIDSDDDVPEYVITKDMVSIFDNGTCFDIFNTDGRFDDIIRLLTNGEYDKALGLANTKKAIERFSKGDITIDNGHVYYLGFEVDGRLARRLVDVVQSGNGEVSRLLNFFKSIMKVQDSRVVDELLPFLESNNIELNHDGSFYSYKAVSMNYMDMWSGKIDNSVGEKPEMPRHLVCNDKHITCAPGLHFATYEYSRMWGGSNCRIMKIKVYPENVVSVPEAYKAEKGRCCQYEVVEEIEVVGQ